MSFENSIMSLDKQIKELIKNYNESDIIPRPYSTNFMLLLSDSFEDFKNNLLPLLSRYNRKNERFEQKLDSNYKLYTKKNSQRKSQFLQELSQNSNAIKNSIADIKLKNEEKLQEIDKQIQNLCEDIKIDIASTEQKIQILNIESKERIDELQYQIGVAKNNYTAFISKSNEQLEAKNEIIHSSTSKRTFKFDESNKSVLDFLTKRVLEMEELYQKRLKEFEQEKLKISDAIINQSIKLNNRIKIINSSKNEKLIAAKKKFDYKINEINAQRESISKEYSTKNREILKKFAQRLTDIDNLNDILTNKHKNEKDELTRKFYFENFNYDKDYNLMLDEHNKKLNTYDKKSNPNGYKLLKTNLRIKQKQAEHHKREILQNQIKQINELELAYIKESEKFKNQKYIAEIEKTYDILNVNMEEKTAQDRLNYLEEIIAHEYNTNVSSINQKFYIRANELRSNNEIRNKIFNKDQFKLEAKYRNILEGISKEKTNYENDIIFQNELEHLLHDKENTIFKKETSLNEVSTLLEIEKNKLLYSLNQKKYSLLLQRENNDTNYKKDCLNTSTTYNSKLLNFEISTLTEQKKEINSYCGLEILKKQNEETLNRSLMTKNYLLDLNYIKSSLYVERYKIEKIMVLCAHDTFYKIIDSFSFFITQFVDNIKSFVESTYIPISKLLIFLEDFINVSKTFYFSIIDSYNLILKSLFEKRINFETGFKYKNQFSDLEETFEYNEAKILAKKDSFAATLANYNQTITAFTTKIWTLENEIHILSLELQKKKIDTQYKKEIQNKISNYKFQLKEFYKKNDLSMRLRLLMEKDLNDIPNQLRKNKVQYEKDYSKIYNEQRKESLIYYQSIKTFDKVCNKYKNSLSNIVDVSLTQTITSYKKFFSFLSSISTFYKKNVESITIDFNKIFTKTSSSINKEQNNNIKAFVSKHKQSIKEHEFSVKKNDKELKLSRSEIESKNKITKAGLNREHKSLVLNNKVQILDLLNNYTKQSELIQRQLNYSMAKFSTDLAAIGDNLVSLQLRERKDINKYEEDYKINRILLTDKFERIKKQNEHKYKQLCSNLKNQVNELPYLIKVESKQIEKATKIENNSLKVQISKNQVNHKQFVKQTTNYINMNYLQLNKNIDINNIERNHKCKEINRKYNSHVRNAYKNFLKDSKH